MSETFLRTFAAKQKEFAEGTLRTLLLAYKEDNKIT